MTPKKIEKVDQRTADIFKDLAMPEDEEVKSKADFAPVGDSVVRVLEDYPGAIVRAQMNDETDIEVSEDIWKHPRIGGRVKGNSFTTGKPGVRVWKEGTKEDGLKLEKLNAEAWHEHHMKASRGNG